MLYFLVFAARRAAARRASAVTAILGFAALHAFAQLPAYRAPRADDGHPYLNGIWQTLNSGCDQVVVPGADLNNLNGNLYIPFSVMPGAPPMFPS